MFAGVGDWGCTVRTGYTYQAFTYSTYHVSWSLRPQALEALFDNYVNSNNTEQFQNEFSIQTQKRLNAMGCSMYRARREFQFE